MSRMVVHIKIIVLLCITILILEVYSDQSELSEYISKLKYDPKKILTYRGEQIKKVMESNGHVDDDNNFVVITRERKSLMNGHGEIGVVSANEHNTYPGVLLIADNDFVDNTPNPLAVKRAPIKYTVNLPGLIGDKGSFSIAPTFADYQSSLNKILQNYFLENPKGQDVNSNFQYSYSMAYSMDQLRVAFGAEFKYLLAKLNINFEAIRKNEQLVKVIRFKQVFFTTSVESPTSPGSVFHPSVTLEELTDKVNNETPPLLVDSVSYGRVMYVKIQTSSTERSAKVILESKFDSFNIHTNNEVDYSKQLKDFNMQVYVLGGSSDQVELIDARTMKDINDVIIKFKDFGENNPVYPISYSCQFLMDNSRAMVHSSTDYTEITRNVNQRGLLKFIHHGWYVAHFVVEWDKVTYDNRGNELIERIQWEDNAVERTAPYHEEIQLPGNCRNIAVTVWVCTGLPWDWWRKLFQRKGIPLIAERTFSVRGSTLKPTYTITPAVEQ